MAVEREEAEPQAGVVRGVVDLVVPFAGLTPGTVPDSTIWELYQTASPMLPQDRKHGNQCNATLPLIDLGSMMSKKSSRIQKAVFAEAFCLVDGKGNTKATLNTTHTGDPYIKMYDGKGQVAVSIDVYENSTGITIGTEGQSIGGIACMPASERVAIWLNGLDGSRAFVFEADKLTSTRRFQIFNKDGACVVNLEI